MVSSQVRTSSGRELPQCKPTRSRPCPWVSAGSAGVSAHWGKFEGSSKSAEVSPCRQGDGCVCMDRAPFGRHLVLCNREHKPHVGHVPIPMTSLLGVPGLVSDMMRSLLTSGIRRGPRRHRQLHDTTSRGGLRNSWPTGSQLSDDCAWQPGSRANNRSSAMRASSFAKCDPKQWCTPIANPRC